MEKVISPEERMRRAEEIYYRRKSQGIKVTTSPTNNKKRLSIRTKMIIQIIICVCIYSTFWVIKGYNSVFSSKCINETKKVLAYDLNFLKLYNDGVEYFNINFNNIIKNENKSSKDQMHEDAEFVKSNYSIIKPIDGSITSGFGEREPTEIISAFHQGIDIEAVTGTPIYAGMEGDVIEASFNEDYGNHIKILKDNILTVYAHCSELEVNVGDHIVQGQEIGKVGDTGKATRSTFTF